MNTGTLSSIEPLETRIVLSVTALNALNAKLAEFLLGNSPGSYAAFAMKVVQNPLVTTANAPRVAAGEV